MIQSVCTVLNDGQDPLNTMNMEIYVQIWVFPVSIFRHDWDNILVNKFTEMDVYLDIRGGPFDTQGGGGGLCKFSKKNIWLSLIKK